MCRPTGMTLFSTRATTRAITKLSKSTERTTGRSSEADRFAPAIRFLPPRIQEKRLPHSSPASRDVDSGKQAVLEADGRSFDEIAAERVVSARDLPARPPPAGAGRGWRGGAKTGRG